MSTREMPITFAAHEAMKGPAVTEHNTQRPTSIAFFDLDRTLLASNSARLWLRFELARGHIRWRQAARAIAWLIRYELGASDMNIALRRSLATLAGTSEIALRARTQLFFERDVQHLFRPGARCAVEEHRAAGDRIVLLTAASEYLSRAVVTELVLHDACCTRLQVDERGNFTGAPVEPLCFGRGKLSLASEYAARHATTLTACAFYTDSASDLPVLEAVGKPVAVNPDPRLRRIARRRGWRVVDWGEPRRRTR